VMGVSFVRLTNPVRLANSDDVIFQKVVRSDHAHVEQYFAELSRSEGRFYFAVPVHRIPYALYNIQNPQLFACLRTLALLIQLALLGVLLARFVACEAIGWLYAVIAFAALHIPSIFYPVLSYPVFWVGSIAILVSIHSYLSYARSLRPGWLFLSAISLLYALICHENFLTFVVLYPFVELFGTRGRTYLAAFQRCLPIALIAAAYVGVYLAFRRLCVTDYNGVHFSADLRAAMLSWTRQTLAAAPGIELILNREGPYPNTGPLWKTPHEIAVIMKGLDPSNAVLALACALIASILMKRAQIRRRDAIGLIVLFAAATALPNVIPSLSTKYQLNAHHRFYPYVYSFTSYCWGIGAVLLLILSLKRFPQTNDRRVSMIDIGTFVFLSLVFISAAGSNQNTAGLLKSWFN
jgi:hypothetical protein